MNEMTIDKHTCTVFEGGYEIVPGFIEKRIPRKVLVRKESSDATYASVDIFHDDNKAAFMTFATLGQSDDSIKEFANQYGLLGCIEPIYTLGGDIVNYGESIDKWIHHIDSMTSALVLKTAIEENDQQVLANHIVWSRKDDADSCEYYKDVNIKEGNITFDENSNQRSKHDAFPIFSPSVNAEIKKYVEPGDLIRPAKFALKEIINLGLLENVHVELDWETGYFKDLSKHIVIKNLIGGLWMQFANTVANGLTYRQCVECNKWFYVRGGEKSVKRKFCSNTCKTRDYRRRKGNDN